MGRENRSYWNYFSYRTKIATLREKLLKKTTGRGGASWFCMADQIRKVVTRAFQRCTLVLRVGAARRGRCVYAGRGASGACDAATPTNTKTNARGRAQITGRAAAFCRNTDRNRRRPRFQRECNRRPKLHAHPFAQGNMGVVRAS